MGIKGDGYKRGMGIKGWWVWNFGLSSKVDRPSNSSLFLTSSFFLPSASPRRLWFFRNCSFFSFTSFCLAATSSSSSTRMWTRPADSFDWRTNSSRSSVRWTMSPSCGMKSSDGEMKFCHMKKSKIEIDFKLEVFCWFCPLMEEYFADFLECYGLPYFCVS